MTISANYPTVNPSLDLDFANSRQLDPRVSFQRATTGTYYDGVTNAVAEQNLVSYSYIFTTGWGANASTVTNPGTITDPFNGTLGTKILQGSTGTGGSGINGGGVWAMNAGQVYTFSVYLKYDATGAQQYINLFVYDSTTGSSTQQVCFDILNGVVTQAVSGNGGFVANSTSITAAANGWFRASITLTPTANQTNTVAYIAMSNVANPTSFSYGYPQFVPNGTNYFYVFGAQMEAHSSAGAYTATTGTKITNYIPQLRTAPVNQPRFDANPTTGASLGLLMEQQSTNLLTYSSDYTQSVWAATNATVTASANISPDGTLDAQSLTDNSTNGLHNITQTQTLTATPYTFSIYAKAGSITYMKMSLATSGTNGVIFNLSTGAYVSNDAGFTYTTPQSVGNGWYKYSITFTGTAASYIAQVLLCSNSTTFSYIGSGQNAYFFGAQVEATAFPTSYIPTQASQVTRAQDFATMTGNNFSSWFNPNQGTIYCSFDMVSITATNYFTLYEIDNGSAYGYFAMRQGSGLVYSNGPSTTSSLALTGANVTQQSAMQFTNITTPAFLGLVNGGSAVSATSFIGYSPTQMRFGYTYQGGNTLNGHIRKFAYYPIASTTAQMQAITGS
jgi:hypothetical protein